MSPLGVVLHFSQTDGGMQPRKLCCTSLTTLRTWLRSSAFEEAARCCPSVPSGSGSVGPGTLLFISWVWLLQVLRFVSVEGPQGRDAAASPPGLPQGGSWSLGGAPPAEVVLSSQGPCEFSWENTSAPELWAPVLPGSSLAHTLPLWYHLPQVLARSRTGGAT